MYKETKNGSVNFHATVKTFLPPTILDQFVDDDGELNYVLSGNKTTLASRYNALWLPAKTEVNWKSKGERIDGKQRLY